MNKRFYPRLAADNIRKNRRTYLPYALTCTGTIAMFYIIYALSQNSGIENIIGSSTIQVVLSLGNFVVGLFAVIFLFYTNSFLIKRRKKEFGLYNILGMEKRHIAKVIGYETLFLSLGSLAVGLLAGLLLSKLAFLAVLKLLDFEVVMGFEVSTPAVLATLLLFGFTFLLIYLNNLRQIHTASPIELLRGGQTGEREPKTKWLLTLAGLGCTGGGYAIALTITDPLSALTLFFLAVILVIVGTYCLFTAGSIALLKLLRKNKRFYYESRHFISVSSLLYRMKQNAAGLANICILSTMVLVMISSTSSLYIGMEEVIQKRYPRDFTLTTSDYSEASLQNIENTVNRVLEKEGLRRENDLRYTFLEFSGLEQGDAIYTDENQFANAVSSNIRTLFFVSAEDYGAISGQPVSLRQDEVLFFSGRTSYAYDTLRVFDRTFVIRERPDSFPENGLQVASVVNTYYIVVPDRATIEDIYRQQEAVYGENCSHVQYYCGFDLPVEAEAQERFYEQLRPSLNDSGFSGRIESREVERHESYGMMGGLFFLGLFLGLLFIMATVLIIYYKQISEGLDDRERFAIMQKVGLDREEIRRSIRSQVLLMFFLPLAAAALHVAAAFRMIAELLALLGLTNVSLFVACTIGSVLLFALFYAVIYVLTARVYYHLVSDPTDR